MKLKQKFNRFETVSSDVKSIWKRGCVFFCLFGISVFLNFEKSTNAQEENLPAIHIGASENKTAVPENKTAVPERKKAPSSSETPKNTETSVHSASKSAESAESPVISVETAAFNGIIPGKTSAAELHKTFGEPANVQKNAGGDGIDVEEYKLEGFQGVAFHVMKKTVFAVVAELAQSVNARELAGQLEISHIQSVFLMDEKGTIHGEIFPEIGVAFAYNPKDKLGNASDFEKNPETIPMNVIQILFQPVGPEPFLLRAETWVDADPVRAYGDILQALKLDPKNKQALAYKKILEESVPGIAAQKGVKKQESVSAKSSEDTQNSGNVPDAGEENASDSGKESASEKETASSAKKEGGGLSASTPDVTHLDAPDVSAFAENGENTENTENKELPAAPETEEHAVSSLPDSLSLSPDEDPVLPGNAEKLNVPAETAENTAENTAESSEKNSAAGVNETEEGISDSASDDAEVAELAAEMERSADSESENAAPALELPASLDSAPEPESEPELPAAPDSGMELSAGSENEKTENLELSEKNENKLVITSEMEEKLEKNFQSLTNPPAVDASETGIILSFEEELFEKVEYLARRGNLEQAQELLEEVRKRFLENPFVAFRANIVEGDIQMISPKPDVTQAFQCHRRAVQQADALLSAGKIVDGRKSALTSEETLRVKELRLDAWLGVAADIASGPWDKKEENVEKWLKKISDGMKELLEDSGMQDPERGILLKYRTSYRSAAIEITLQNVKKTEEYADSFLDASLEMLKNAKTAAQYYYICVQASQVLDDAASLCMMQGEFTCSERYLLRSISMMELVKAKKKEVTTPETFLLAKLYYHSGQIHALRADGVKNDTETALHREAVTWYEKAIPHLMTVIQSKKLEDLMQLGVIVNGMSVSYAEIGETKRAVTLLKTGIFCLEHHVDVHPEDRRQLEIPYSNMIQLMDFLGDTYEKAQYQRKLDALAL